MRAGDVRAALTRKFCAPEWAIFYEVAQGTGARGGRFADAVAMNLWPSRGCELHGFEIKVSRSDWLNELKQPEKSMPIQRFTDRWWIVTPTDVIKPGELPPTWGHYIVKGNGLNVATEAPKLDREGPDRPFLAALLRRAHEHAQAAIKHGIDDAMQGERAAIDAEVKRQVDAALSIRRESEDSARNQLKKLQDACGFTADEARWFDGSGFAEAVAAVHRLGVARSYSGLTSAAATARRFAESVDQMLPAS